MVNAHLYSEIGILGKRAVSPVDDGPRSYNISTWISPQSGVVVVVVVVVEPGAGDGERGGYMESEPRGPSIGFASPGTDTVEQRGTEIAEINDSEAVPFQFPNLQISSGQVSLSSSAWASSRWGFRRQNRLSGLLGELKGLKRERARDGGSERMERAERERGGGGEDLRGEGSGERYSSEVRRRLVTMDYGLRPSKGREQRVMGREGTRGKGREEGGGRRLEQWLGECCTVRSSSVLLEGARSLGFFLGREL
ncbi:uncharacterized protein BP5553_02581 [Venustampulla echinocandica]|uniref:Uncharacterized protein n=1 Tax=Venustampulla echinocandica TaxID=2656787 RepID=A0A370TRV0_9HELO|nr:uncharacterized protein BP5553_02581 [Venustampulla echinocandica]RDL38241.1 hypothetical protein BP5553_02581 [Venustampulla echinocandica]